MGRRRSSGARAGAGRRIDDRQGDPRRHALAQHRPAARRTIDCRVGCERASEGRVLRRRRRRVVEDDRRRPVVDAGHRRPDHDLVGRRGRRLGIESGHRVHRHRRIVHPRQHHAGRRRVQVDRRRQDVDARRPVRHEPDRPDADPPDESVDRLCRGDRSPVRRQRRARRVPIERRRQELGEGAVCERQDRCRRHRDGCDESAGPLRDDVAGAANAVGHLQHRPRLGTL